MDYGELTYEELRELLLSGELKHEYMEEEDYRFLLDNEMDFSGDPNGTVIDFCTDGLTRFDKYKDCGNIEIDIGAIIKKAGRQREYYRKMPCKKLRGLVLEGQADQECMSEFDYERLLQYEANLYNPDVIVLNFCANGLGQLSKYKDREDILIYETVMLKLGEKKRKRIIKMPKKVAVAALTAIVSLFIVTATAAAMGYNVVDLIRKAINNPEKPVTGDDGKDAIFEEDIRVYKSMDEMIETENLKILYPAELPNGYKFTDFRVDNKDGQLEIRAYASEPYITFIVKLEEHCPIENFDYEINGIKYNIMEIENGLYQAYWNDGIDYYEIAISDKAMLSQIIKNLKES